MIKIGFSKTENSADNREENKTFSTIQNFENDGNCSREYELTLSIEK